MENNKMLSQLQRNMQHWQHNENSCMHEQQQLDSGIMYVFLLTSHIYLLTRLVLYSMLKNISLVQQLMKWNNLSTLVSFWWVSMYSTLSPPSVNIFFFLIFITKQNGVERYDFMVVCCNPKGINNTKSTLFAWHNLFQGQFGECISRSIHCISVYFEWQNVEVLCVASSKPSYKVTGLKIGHSRPS